MFNPEDMHKEKVLLESFESMAQHSPVSSPAYTIAMVCACPFPSSQGSQVFIKQLSEALHRRGHTVHVVTYHFGEDLETSGLAITRIPRLLSYDKLRAGPSLKKPLLDLLLSARLKG